MLRYQTIAYVVLLAYWICQVFTVVGADLGFIIWQQWCIREYAVVWHVVVALGYTWLSFSIGILENLTEALGWIWIQLLKVFVNQGYNISFDISLGLSPIVT